MLLKSFRGLTSSEVSELFQHQHGSSSNRFFRVLWRKTEEPSPRFVVVVTKKFHKSAVTRNRSRRMVYDLLPRTFSRWTEGVRVAIVVKTSALQASKHEFEQAMYDVMHKSGFV
ncbi:MAG: ribonuclease P protein component [Candidatus Altimarinota bacterium]